MDIENWAQWSIDPNEFWHFDADFYLALAYLIISIAIYGIFIWHFYRFIARRDCFKLRPTSHPRIVGFLKYFFLFPFVAFLFFMGFSLLILFLTRVYENDMALSTSFALVLAIRITAYYSEDLSKDVAKMLPFALLGVFLVDPSYFDFTAIVDKINTIPDYFTQMLQYILLIIIVEWILRIALTIKRTICPSSIQPNEP
jgi:hypothetical protein